MLTRFRLRRDFRVLSRYLADKPSDSDGKIPQVNSQENGKTKGDSKTNASTEKIQDLLKKMMAANQDLLKEQEFVKAPIIPRKQRKQKIDEIEVKTEKIEESITQAAGKVAEAIGGDMKQTEAELLSKVLGKINQTSTSLSDLISGMQVDRSKDGRDEEKETRGQQVKRMVDRSRSDNATRYAQRKDRPRQDDRLTRNKDTRSAQNITSVDIFGGEPLGIFKTKDENYGTKLEVWEALKQRELTLATAQPPANYFQKMALWTKQGKVWKFPIDNEQGLEEEQNVHFSEHIFLDAHLEGWCPKKGPIRHFMELVCVGLSKNAFYTVQEKKDHIMWYKEYFESKKDLLSEVGAWDNLRQDKSDASI